VLASARRLAHAGGTKPKDLDQDLDRDLKLVLGTHLTKRDLADVTAHSCHSMVIGTHIDADDVHTNPQARRLHAPGTRWTDAPARVYAPDLRQRTETVVG
jgi:hypothetical protein